MSLRSFQDRPPSTRQMRMPAREPPGRPGAISGPERGRTCDTQLKRAAFTAPRANGALSRLHARPEAGQTFAVSLRSIALQRPTGIRHAQDHPLDSDVRKRELFLGACWNYHGLPHSSDRPRTVIPRAVAPAASQARGLMTRRERCERIIWLRLLSSTTDHADRS